MGQLTRAQIVDEGINLAGNSQLTTRANTWLNAWLRSQYAAWPWPFLHKRISGVALASASTSLLLGAGSNGVTAEIRRVLDPIQLYDSAYSLKGQLRIRPNNGANPLWDESSNNPSLTGLPSHIKVAQDTLWGRWKLYPWPIPQTNYLLAIDYLEAPADLSADASVPIYPNDRTMIQAVYTDALKYEQAGEDMTQYRAELEVLGRMVVDDRMKYGDVTGTNDQLGLDTNTFR